MKTTAKAKQFRRELGPLPDPLLEEEVKIQISWSADKRTATALQRQSELMGFASPADYLYELISSTLAGNEEDTCVLDDETLVSGCELRERIRNGRLIAD